MAWLSPPWVCWYVACVASKKILQIWRLEASVNWASFRRYRAGRKTHRMTYLWWVQPNDKNWSHEIGANVCEQHGKVSNVLFERARSLEAKVLNAFQAYTLCRYIKIRSYTDNQLEWIWMDVFRSYTLYHLDPCDRHADIEAVHHYCRKDKSVAFLRVGRTQRF